MSTFQGKIWIAGSLIIFLGITVYLRNKREKLTPKEPATLPAILSEKTKVNAKLSAPKEPSNIDKKNLYKAPLNETQNFLQYYGDPLTSPNQDLVYLSSVLQIFNSHLKGKTLLPTDSNKSLVKTLQGNNALNLEFIPSDFKYLNSEQELVDRWDNPLSFHFNNIDQPEIRSAGEDGRLWNDDDIIFEN